MNVLKQKFTPNPGRIAVVREAMSVDVARAERAGLAVADETRDYAKRANPFALVVGVGEPEVTQYGTTIYTDILPGDMVAVAEVGKYLTLDDGEGGDTIYVMPFGGVLGRLTFHCDSCGFESRTRPESAPKCPQCPDLVAPTLADQNLVNLTRK